jgi:hypothetical protein
MPESKKEKQEFFFHPTTELDENVIIGKNTKI